MTQLDGIEERLRYLEKMESLGLLVGGVAHNFNNILQPILGYSDLLRGSFDADSEEHEFVVSIAEAARRGREIVAQIMAYTGHRHAPMKVYDLIPIIRDAAKLVRSTLPTSTTLEEHIVSEYVPIFCDASQIHQAMINLCLNAHQAIEGKGKIRITLHTITLQNFLCPNGTTLSGDCAYLSVTDNGMGIDDDTLPNIFKPLFTTKAGDDGSGFGLSSVLDTVNAHAGGIEVFSEPSKGSTFEIYLPLSDASVDEVPAPDYWLPAVATEAILFVDDEPAIRRLGRSILETEGYNLTVAADGQEALRIFQENPEYFDLVITDRTMPVLNGEQVAVELRGIMPDIPVILCSGRRPTDSTANKRIHTMEAYLDKPFTADRMRRVVRETLDLSARRRWEVSTSND